MVRVVPLICAEALRDPALPDTFDIAVIASLDASPEQFQAFIQTQVANRRVVAYCNWAQAGGSFVHAAKDERKQNWLRDTFPTGLPPTEAILVVDVDLDVTSIETGVTNPGDPLELVRCVSTSLRQVSRRITDSPPRLAAAG